MAGFVEFKTFRDVMELSRFISDRLITIGGRGKVAVSIGTTFREIFNNWNKIFSKYQYLNDRDKGDLRLLPAFYPVDERLVSIEHKESNWGDFL